jgi:2-oxoglutarate dehydrogenase E2 component (dihydrolipoamide succinyltransferase)
VVKGANNLNLIGTAKSVNNLTQKARNNNLKPDDVQGGTFTITNIGTFGNIIGTPIINQPEVAILATGVIQKKTSCDRNERRRFHWDTSNDVYFNELRP